MKFRVLRHSAALGLLAALFTSGSLAKGIAVDETIVCPSPPIAQTAAGQISLGGSNSANSGVTGLPAWACNDTMAMDTGAIPYFTFNNTTSTFNTWVALNGQPPSYVETNPLSTLQGAGLVTLVSQVGVYQLTGLQSGYSGNLTSVSGDYEVQFNYDNYGGGGPCPASHASLTWGGSTWSFSGAGGVGLCDLSSTNDFLFSSSGSLLGYLNASGSLVSASPPPGWVHGTVSTPEPGTLALWPAAALLMLLARRRLRPALLTDGSPRRSLQR
jgi:hypothetical protein